MFTHKKNTSQKIFNLLGGICVYSRLAFSCECVLGAKSNKTDFAFCIIWPLFYVGTLRVPSYVSNLNKMFVLRDSHRWGLRWVTLVQIVGHHDFLHDIIDGNFCQGGFDIFLYLFSWHRLRTGGFVRLSRGIFAAPTTLYERGRNPCREIWTPALFPVTTGGAVLRTGCLGQN